MALPRLSLLQTSHSTSTPQMVVTSPSKPGQVQSPPSTPPPEHLKPPGPSLTWPPFSVRKTYLTLGSGKVAADWMLAMATLVGSSPVATAPELQEQRTHLHDGPSLCHLRAIHRGRSRLSIPVTSASTTHLPGSALSPLPCQLLSAACSCGG